jgi:hypothetical protein
MFESMSTRYFDSTSPAFFFQVIGVRTLAYPPVVGHVFGLELECAGKVQTVRRSVGP